MWEMMLYMIPIHILYEYTGMVNIYFYSIHYLERKPEKL